jgi:hypothetical protein
LRSRCFFGLTEGSIPKLCSMMERLTPTRLRADQEKTSLFLDRQQRSLSSSCEVRSSLMVTVCLGVAWSRGTVVVALQLCLVMFFGGWAGRLGDLALGREAVYIPLPRNEVSFYVARDLLVVVDCDCALRTWDLHAQVKS